MSNNTRMLLSRAMWGLIILAVIFFVTTQFMFRDLRDVRSIFSLIWIAVLAVLIYQKLIDERLDQDSTNGDLLYRLMRYVIELITILTLVFTAIIAVLFLTSPDGNSTLAIAIGISALFVVLSLVIPWMLRRSRRREQSAEKDTKTAQ